MNIIAALQDKREKSEIENSISLLTSNIVIITVSMNFGTNFYTIIIEIVTSGKQYHIFVDKQGNMDVKNDFMTLINTINNNNLIKIEHLSFLDRYDTQYTTVNSSIFDKNSNNIEFFPSCFSKSRINKLLLII